MNVREWRSRTDPTWMLECLAGRASDRKFRLFCVGCCRGIWDELPDDSFRSAVEVAEQLADGIVGAGAVQRVRRMVEGTRRRLPYSKQAFACWVAVRCALDRSRLRGVPLSQSQAQNAAYCELWASKVATADTHLPLLRCVFGNPFRPVTFASEWRTSTAVAIAKGMYESRDFSAMPILADALQDAGCGDASILKHCRESGGHARGCWVIDLLLEKE